MARSIMIQGTASNAGKSLIAAGLCRIFREEGYTVAPFKSQNMASNSYITGKGLEMSRAQAMQAEACGILPDVMMNPILLKPTGDSASEVIINGVSRGKMGAREYFRCRRELVPEIMRAYRTLAAHYDIIVIEGAGSPAEINLREDDIVNMGMAQLAGAPVLLVGDIDRGGVFASLAGTLMLLEEDERQKVKGVIINKFRGDVTILEPGLRMLEGIIHVPVVGVVPYLDLCLEDEDSLSERLTPGGPLHEGISQLDLAVLRLPHRVNVTDFTPFEKAEGVRLRYVTDARMLGDPDIVFVPGTRCVSEDVQWLRSVGLEPALVQRIQAGKPIWGMGRGWRLLSTLRSGAQTEGEATAVPENVHETPLPSQAEGILPTVEGLFSGLSGLDFKGYRMGEDCKPFAHSGSLYGTDIHGFFDRGDILRVFLESLWSSKGLTRALSDCEDMDRFKQRQYDKLAENLRQSLDWKQVCRIVEEGL